MCDFRSMCGGRKVTRSRSEHGKYCCAGAHPTGKYKFRLRMHTLNRKGMVSIKHGTILHGSDSARPIKHGPIVHENNRAPYRLDTARFSTGAIVHESVMQKRLCTGSIVHQSKNEENNCFYTDTSLMRALRAHTEILCTKLCVPLSWFRTFS